MLVLGPGGHDGQGSRAHVSDGGRGSYRVCRMAVGVKGAEVPWERVGIGWTGILARFLV